MQDPCARYTVVVPYLAEAGADPLLVQVLQYCFPLVVAGERGDEESIDIWKLG